MLKTTTIAQFDGFGNLKQKTQGEYFRGNGVSKGANGISFNKYVYEQKDSNNASVPALFYAYAKGLGTFTGDYLYMRVSSTPMIYQSYSGSFAPEEVYYITTMNYSGLGNLIGDPKGRLIMCGTRYLAMFDQSVGNATAGTVSVTNGSGAIVGSGTAFTAGMVGKKFRVTTDTGSSSFYTVATYTDATHITISGTYAGTTGSGKAYVVLTAWTETWKDFGADVNNQVVMENYESTVLFGRDNKITTLDVNTDTITTDASPSFSMPSGYTIKKINVNKGGILMSFDAYDGSTLVLWDNQSTRSIAPWIKVKDQVLDVMKYGGSWLVVTTKSIYITDGYTLTLFVDSFLDSDIATIYAFEGEIVNNYMYFCINYSSNTKQRDGFYRMDLKNGLCEYWGTFDGAMYGNQAYKHIFYVPLQNFLVFNDSAHHMKAVFDTALSTKTYTYITNPVVKSSTKKVAKKINAPITISSTYNAVQNTEGFTISAYISPVTRQQNFRCYPSSASTVLNQVKFTTAYFPTFQVGESLEILSGTNKGLIRHITAVSTVAGVTTVTLDTDLPNLAQTGDFIEYTPFQFVGTYTVSASQAVEMKSLMFTVKNEIVGKGFMVKFVVTGATIPIEIMPFDFIYDDLGIL